MCHYLYQVILSFSALLFACINHDSAVLGLTQRFLTPQVRRYRYGHGTTALTAKRNWSPNPTPPPPNPIDSQPESDVPSEGLKYTLELPKAMGVNWGSDLSFRWIFVNSLDESGAAASSGVIKKGDVIIGVGEESVIGRDFNEILTAISMQPVRSNFTFFRGSKDQLFGSEYQEPSQRTLTVTVLEQGKPERKLSCPGGSNLRNVLVQNGVNVYRSITRVVNCGGKQRCGTCILEVLEGIEGCSRRGLDEEMVLKENPENYRLCCVTSIYSDVTVRVQGPVGASQWTR